MTDRQRRIALFHALFFVVLLWRDVPAHSQPPLYRIGAPYSPARPPRLTTDNGIPGSGAYYYRDYPWPSLRQALQEYGLFGRRFRKRGTAPGAPEALLPR